MSYAYDASGNLTARGSTAFQYTSENRLSKVSAGATACRYTYDGDGGRSKRLDADGTVHYVGDYERNVGAGSGLVVVTKYYYALGRLVAFRKGGVLHWAEADHLGGTIRTLDASFSVGCGDRVERGTGAISDAPVRDQFVAGDESVGATSLGREAR